MTPEQISVIIDLFENAQKKSDDLGLLFYERLSNDYPEVSEIFESASMNAQHTRFISMMNIILARMINDRPVKDLLQDLGEQHQKYRVNQMNIEKFGVTLTKVLKELMGNEFNGELRQLWTVFFNEITQHMIAPKPTCHGE